MQEDISLLPFNTFHLESRAQFLLELDSEALLQEYIAEKKWKTLPRLVLGGGSNVLLTGDVPGVVLLNRLPGIRKVKEDSAHIYVTAGAGVVWHQLVLFCIENGYAGIENLSLIPGLTGAAPMQNIGAYGVELKDVFEELEAIHLETGERRTFNLKDCRFGYRDSIFKNECRGQYVITSVTLRLLRVPRFCIDYGDIRKELDDMRVQELSLQNVSAAICNIRRSKLPNPDELGNAGSFFKNPVIPASQCAGLLGQYPLMPHYPQPDGTEKIAAGWLIEQCGWKGKQVGHTGAHARQALVLVNYGGATGQEIYALAGEISRSVESRFGIRIEPEVNLI